MVSKTIPLIAPVNTSTGIGHKIYREDNTTKAVQEKSRSHQPRETLRGKVFPLPQTFLVLDNK